MKKHIQIRVGDETVIGNIFFTFLANMSIDFKYTRIN